MPGALLYEGPSLIDAQPIFVAAIWSSKNRKTGALLQTYIMRSDINPLDASKFGEDFSICGDCKHRGTPTLDPERKVAERRSCYVNLGQGPLIVWRQYEKRAYRHADPAELGAHQRVRLGTYGDPAVVPSRVWEQLLSRAKGWTGYTHQRFTPGADFKPWMTMVSADSRSDASSAWSRGYRTFRIVANTSELVKGKEVLCPASAEAGHKTTCEKCMLCAGSQQAARSIAIVAHGAGKGYV
jgi:hypothetical protein